MWPDYAEKKDEDSPHSARITPRGLSWHGERPKLLRDVDTHTRALCSNLESQWLKQGGMDLLHETYIANSARHISRIYGALFCGCCV